MPKRSKKDSVVTQTITTLPTISDTFPKQALLIADIFAQWGALELYLANLFAIFTGMDQYQARLVQSAVVSTKAKIDLLNAAGTYLMRSQPHQLQVDLVGLHESLTTVADIRNRYAHGVFAKNQRGQLCMLFPKYEWPSHTKSVEIVTIARLQNELKDFVAAGVKVGELLRHLEWVRMEPELRHTLTEISPPPKRPA